MSLYAGAVLPNPNIQFCDANGSPLASGTLTFYQAGTTTLQNTYSDSGLTTPNTNPITLDSAGRSATAIYLSPTGYKVVLKDANGVTLWTRDTIEDVGQVFANTWGTLLATGHLNVSSGYTVQSTDRLVTVDSASGAATVNLLAASSATQPLCIKNAGGHTVAITPNGSDTIDGANSAYSLAAASAPTYPSVLLVSDGVSAWWILASHG